MISILYEFKVPPPREKFSTLGWYIETHRIYGETGAEIQERAKELAVSLGCSDYMAAGIHNSKADWEAAFGPSTDPDYTFADTFDPQPPPSTSTWQKWLHKFHPFAKRVGD